MTYHTQKKGATMPAKRYKVTGHSGQTEIIEAATPVAANKEFVDHHGEPAASTMQVADVHERDTARG